MNFSYALRCTLTPLDYARRSELGPGPGWPAEWTCPPRKQKIESRVSTAAVAAKGRDLSQLSHELTGRCRTVASIPDTQHDADLRFWIVGHWPHRSH